MLWIIPGIIVSYLLGSLPTAYIFGRILKGIDIRKFGSGNVGATNALRVLGKGAGITVLAIDILKGFIAVIFIGNFIAPKIVTISGQTLRVILGLSCIFGHNWTVFLGFRGGKGVATTLGVLLGLAIKISGLGWAVALMILNWIVVFFIVRVVSAASVFAAITLPIYMIVFRQSGVLLLLSIILCLFIILRHRSNLKRFFQGKEPRLKF
jgi:glycerol-3-phosphate acyltransferase PlsY